MTPVVALIVAFVVFYTVFKHLISPESMEARTGIMARLLRRLPIKSFNIIIVAWQILTQFATSANVIYPGIYQSLLKVVDIINFNPTWLPSVGCAMNVDFHGQFFIMTIGPILVILMLIAPYTYVARKYHESKEVLEIVRNRHVSALLFILFLVYSSTSSVVFQVFNCDTLDDGNSYLRADNTIECDEVRHRDLMIWAVFAILVYPVGIPLFFAFLLFKSRSVLLDKNLREKHGSMGSISDLWKPYKPMRFYYEVVECSRRTMLIGVMAVIQDDSATQIAAALMLSFVFFVISEGLAPYESHMDAWVNRLGHAVVVFSMYYALLLKVDISNDSLLSQNVFEVMLISIHVLMIVLVIAEATMKGYTLKKEAGGEPILRNNRYRSQETPTSSRSPNVTVTKVDSDEIQLSVCRQQ